MYWLLKLEFLSSFPATGECEKMDFSRDRWKWKENGSEGFVIESVYGVYEDGEGGWESFW